MWWYDVKVKRYPVSIEGRRLELTNPERVLWPEDGLTKADLVRHYVDMSPYLLPFLRDRPLVFTRYPEGIHGKSFYQKNAPVYTPPWIRKFPYSAPSGERVVEFILVDEVAALAWLANQACIEIHPWFSRVGSLDYPDFAVFDLDPAEPAGFEEARAVAQLVKTVLDEAGLEGWPKTSGATGIHIYVPLENRYPYKEVAGFVQRVASLLCQAFPERITLERAVKRRGGKVYIDYLQNIRGKTIVGAYVPRPLPGAPVSTPFTWRELPGLQPAGFNMKSLGERLRQVGDLYAGFLSRGQSLEEAQRRLFRGSERP